MTKERKEERYSLEEMKSFLEKIMKNTTKKYRFNYKKIRDNEVKIKKTWLTLKNSFINKTNKLSKDSGAVNQYYTATAALYDAVVYMANKKNTDPNDVKRRESHLTSAVNDLIEFLNTNTPHVRSARRCFEGSEYENIENKFSVKPLNIKERIVDSIEGSKNKKKSNNHAERKVDKLKSQLNDFKENLAPPALQEFKELSKALKTYKSERENRGGGKNYLHSVFKSFQYSKEEKFAAVKALKKALKGEEKISSDNLKALRQGQLGKAVRNFVKRNGQHLFDGKNVSTVRKFVEALNENIDNKLDSRSGNRPK